MHTQKNTCKDNVRFLTKTPSEHSLINPILLQQRLKIVAIIYFTGLLIFYIRELIIQSEPFTIQLVALVLLFCFAIALALFKNQPIWSLRIWELLIFGVMSALLVIKYSLFIIEASEQGKIALVQLNKYFMASGFFALIVIYGLFVPNNCKRTVLVTLIFALIPFLSHLILNLIHPSIKQAGLQFWTGAYLTFGIFISVYGSHTLNQLRREVIDAKKIGQYKLIERIGSGGMGEVWKARHNMLARPAAVKLIRQETLNSEQPAIIRFEREAEAIASLTSPHTVEIYDFGIADSGAFYYVMELLEGIDLDDLIEKFGPINSDRTVYILRQICKSLEEAHSKGLVHRDIKPANIFICKKGLEYDFVKVLDFGMVKREEDVEKAKLTEQGVITGTPTFIAPEMVSQDKINAKADIYLVGCVAYWLLTGQYVFYKENVVAILMDHLQTKPTPPSQLIKNSIPECLEQIIMSCLEKDPNKRPDSVAALFHSLSNCASVYKWNEEKAKIWWQENLYST